MHCPFNFDAAIRYWNDYIDEGVESKEDLLHVIICIHQESLFKGDAYIGQGEVKQ